MTGAADVEALLRQAARAGELTVGGSAIHEFPGGGVTGVLLLSESHFSVHTWPERGHATADLFTCGATVPRRAHEVLLAGFGAERAELLLVRRSDGDARDGDARDDGAMGVADRWTEQGSS